MGLRYLITKRKSPGYVPLSLNVCLYLYVAFISVIILTACFQHNLRRNVTELLQLKKEIILRLKLNTEAKEFLKSTLVASIFTEDLCYVKFIYLLFFKGIKILP